MHPFTEYSSLGNIATGVIAEEVFNVKNFFFSKKKIAE